MPSSALIINDVGKKRAACEEHLHEQDPADLSDREKEARRMGAREACFVDYKDYSKAEDKYEGETDKARQNLEVWAERRQTVKNALMNTFPVALFLSAVNYLTSKK